MTLEIIQRLCRYFNELVPIFRNRPDFVPLMAMCSSTAPRGNTEEAESNSDMKSDTGDASDSTTSSVLNSDGATSNTKRMLGPAAAPSSMGTGVKRNGHNHAFDYCNDDSSSDGHGSSVASGATAGTSTSVGKTSKATSAIPSTINSTPKKDNHKKAPQTLSTARQGSSVKEETSKGH
jgi:hypothetical protein